jgi:hypothetical protein
MSDKVRHFTLREAEKVLPDVDKRMRAVRDLKEKVQTKIAGWQDALAAAHGDPASLPAADEALVKGQINFLVSQINEQLDAVVKLGGLPKDLDLGLIDFPTRLNGRECYLCWKVGEKRIDYWHGLNEGYQGRKPLKRSAPPPQ